MRKIKEQETIWKILPRKKEKLTVGEGDRERERGRGKERERDRERGKIIFLMLCDFLLNPFLPQTKHIKKLHT